MKTGLPLLVLKVLGLIALALAAAASAQESPDGRLEGRFLGGLELRGAGTTNAGEGKQATARPAVRLGLAVGRSRWDSFALDGYFLEYGQDFGGHMRSITAGIISWGPMFEIRRAGLTAVHRQGRNYLGASGQYSFTIFYLRGGLFVGRQGGLATLALGVGF